MNRRIISDKKEIIEDVFNKFDGKYSYDQISDIYDASVSFIHHTIRYTGALAVRIPHIGNMTCNLRELRYFKKIHEGKEKKPIDQHEMKLVNKKIEYLSSKPKKRGHPMLFDIRQSFKKMKLGRKMHEIENFQNEM